MSMSSIVVNKDSRPLALNEPKKLELSVDVSAGRLEVGIFPSTVSGQVDSEDASPGEVFEGLVEDYSIDTFKGALTFLLEQGWVPADLSVSYTISES